MPWFRRKNSERSTHSARDFNTARPYLESPYLLPVDLQDDQRLDLQHYMLRQLRRGNYVAPLANPLSILDVGCGTGRWAAEMARDFPNANIVGVDLKPTSLTSNAILQGHPAPPDNLSLVQADVTQGLPFAANSFDYVRMSIMLFAIPGPAWRPLIQEIWRVLQPFGWAELIDSDTTDQMQTPAWHQFYALLQHIAQLRQLDLSVGTRLGSYLTEAGFKRTEFYFVAAPLGPWGGRLGQLMAANAEAGIKALRQPLLSTGQVNGDGPAFDRMVAQMIADMSSSPGAKQPYYFAFGQKVNS